MRTESLLSSSESSSDGEGERRREGAGEERISGTGGGEDSESDECTISADLGGGFEDFGADFAALDLAVADEGLGFDVVAVDVERAVAFRSSRTVGLGFFDAAAGGFFDSRGVGSGDLRFRAAAVGFELAADVGGFRAGSNGVFAALPVPVR